MDDEGLGKQIVQGLYKERMILTWYRDKPDGWTLASGLYSPFFINLRLICSSDPSLYRLVGKAMAELMKQNGFVSDGRHRIVGIAMAGIPLANAATLESGVPSLYTRKLPEEVKTAQALEDYMTAHGQKSLIEGEFKNGDRLAIIDDLVTMFDSKLLAKSQIEQEVQRRNATDVSVSDVFVLLDREQGGAEAAGKAGINLHSIIPFKSKGLDWLKELLSEVEYETIKDYLGDLQKYQTKEAQDRLRSVAQKR